MHTFPLSVYGPLILPLLAVYPGDGWDRSPRRAAEGELKDGGVEFKGDEYSSLVKDGVMTISLAGVKIGELKKVDRESPTLGARRRKVPSSCSTVRPPTTSRMAR